ncbi:ADP-ribosylglycohydrolase [Oryzihumus leptocrescens]|uniref:ADP-ribosylglycohydrolase n=1 Tax=Oryzihumus leptocrescens TaxID=297536 RepID=A0A542ZKQ5_9MICO|nr:ADP-ribosylglycohydrolase family protein [Oryzihumus leptocrescens]TQL60935.1 ADP-ribosylglycohydrolase [Oryzihumus leptocrescens]
MELTTGQCDRAAGVLLAQACGDALGVPYEFATPPDGEPRMVGGGLGPYVPGEWSDDTQMSLCIARVAARGDLTSAAAQDEVAAAFEGWLHGGASDVGTQTRVVLTQAGRWDGPAAHRLREAAERLHALNGHTAGNGALMRTGVVGLTRLDSRETSARTARSLAELTHTDPLAGDSCVLWSEAVRVAVLEGRFDLISGLDLLPEERRGQWSTWIHEATGVEPKTFSPNGFTVKAFQAAWAAISSTDEGDGSPVHLQRALAAAVHAGDDTDTVAAIAGALLGARYGASAVPTRWRREVHGWPGMRAARDLVSLGIQTARGGVPQGSWPRVEVMATGREPARAVPHPHDPGVLLGTLADLGRTTELGVDAVVSLCRLGTAEAPAAGVAARDHVEVWLVDSNLPSDNAHLDFVLDDAAAAVKLLRAEGRRVLLHCVHAEQRTPSVALRYAVRQGADAREAARAIQTVLPSTRGYGRLWEAATGRLAPVSSRG